MRVSLERRLDFAVPAQQLWRVVTDWERQGDWVPLTRVERLAGPVAGVGERLRAWTGLGPVGFWDTMTVTGRVDPASSDDEGWCEVLHTGRVVRGVGQLQVRPSGRGRSTFLWSEGVELPLGGLGRVAWWAVRPLAARGVDAGLRRLRDLAEAGPAETGHA